MNRSAPRQRGMVLIVTLAMLVVITLFVISMIRLGNTNAIIVGNMQAQKGVEAEAQQAIEIALNKFQFFDDTIQELNSWATSSTAYVTYSTLWTNYMPTGATSQPATGYTGSRLPWMARSKPMRRQASSNRTRQSTLIRSMPADAIDSSNAAFPVPK